MEHTTATGETDSKLAGETLVLPATAKAVVVKGRYINVEEIAFATNVNAVPGPTNFGTPGDRIYGPVDGCLIEFKRKGTLFIPGLTAEGLASLIGGAAF